VLGTDEAGALWQRQAAVFVDVMPQPPKPANLPSGTLWRDPPRSSIPGAVWLPNVGFGEIAAETDAYFQRGLGAATGSDRTRPLVFFCERNCWMSWNAAKRAMTYGYSAVHWYPDGTDGWREAGLPLDRVERTP
jgi:PQQ-dependent catabolism-associated CXXCW motif protein